MAEEALVATPFGGLLNYNSLRKLFRCKTSRKKKSRYANDYAGACANSNP